MIWQELRRGRESELDLLYKDQAVRFGVAGLSMGPSVTIEVDSHLMIILIPKIRIQDELVAHTVHDVDPVITAGAGSRQSKAWGEVHKIVGKA